MHWCLRLLVSSGPIHLSSSHYQLVGVDLRDQKQVEAALRAAGMDWAAPTLILSEVVLTYMETQRYVVLLHGNVPAGPHPLRKALVPFEVEAEPRRSVRLWKTHVYKLKGWWLNLQLSHTL